MIGLDIVGLTVLIFSIVIFLCQPEVPFIMAIFSALIIFLPLAVVLKWPQRFIRSRKRSKIMHHHIQTVCGMFDYAIPYDTGKKESHIVYDGFTQRGLTGEIYSHYHTKDFKVYDGQIGSFIVYKKENGGYAKTSHTIELRTLPKNFFDATETFPDCNEMYELHFVTNTDGTNYLVEAIPLRQRFAKFNFAPPVFTLADFCLPN